ncbi:MAG: sugar phosphate nucleotidyltransferase [archaeon]
MKGVILAGGNGTRLLPLTKVTNKHLLPIGSKPMVYYPIEKLVKAGIKDILIVSGKGHAGHFLELLGSGKEFGVKFSYAIQEEAGGIAQALGLAEDFADNDSMLVLLGDNIFEDEIDVSGYREGARIFLKEVNDASRFGVAEVKNNKVISIEEKPKAPKSKFAVTGAYIFDNLVFEIIKTLKPSWRNELELTDVNNHYIKAGKMDSRILKGYWTDTGTFESLYRANVLVHDKSKKD